MSSTVGTKGWRWFLVLVTAVLPTLVAPVSVRAVSPGFISIMFGRTQFVSVDGAACNALPNTVTLDEAASAMDARGLTGVGNVVVNRIPASGIACQNDLLSSFPGWDWLAARAAMGWEFISAGANYRDMTAITYAEQVSESCGSLGAFTSHGLSGAQGMFAYPNNKWTTAIQINPVSTCFDYGRQYGPGTNVQSQMRAPWFASVWSVNGGRCNDATLPCYTATAPQRYHSPEVIAAAMNVASGTWFNVQFYRFVTGAYSSAHSSWDCTSPDWRQHWSSRTELYCFADFLRVMDAAQASVAAGAIVTDPHTVAVEWGRPAPSPYRPDGMLALGNGPFVGDNVVNADGTGQSLVGVPIARRRTINFRWRVQNDGTSPDVISLRGQAVANGFTVRFWSGTTNITSSVLAGSYSRSLTPGASLTVTLSLSALATATMGTTQTELLTATSQSGVNADAVFAGVTVT